MTSHEGSDELKNDHACLINGLNPTRETRSWNGTFAWESWISRPGLPLDTLLLYPGQRSYRDAKLITPMMRAIFCCPAEYAGPVHTSRD